MRWTYAILPLGLTAVAAFQDPIFAALPMAPFGKMAWLVFFFGYGVVLPVLLMTLAGRSPLQIADELGLAKSPWGAFAFALVATSPVAVGFALTTGINPTLTAREVLYGAIVFPWIEEVFFRGVLFGQLYRRAGWGFWPAALTPAIVFALAHLYQSQDPAEIAGILAITGLGSIVFSYLYVQWGGNIWAPFAGHALLNLWWSVFAVDDTALGDAYANALRLAAVALALGFSYLAPRFGWLKPLTPTSPPSAPRAPGIA